MGALVEVCGGEVDRQANTFQVAEKVTVFGKSDQCDVATIPMAAIAMAHAQQVMHLAGRFAMQQQQQVLALVNAHYRKLRRVAVDFQAIEEAAFELMQTHAIAAVERQRAVALRVAVRAACHAAGCRGDIRYVVLRLEPQAEAAAALIRDLGD